LACVRFAESN